MVKTQESRFKSFGGMARITVLFELPEMNVLMAIQASGLDRFIDDRSLFPLGKMALLTTDLGVFPGQGVAGFLMIKGRYFEPRIVVAAAAILRELALMGIFLVTVLAIGESNLFQLAAGVALSALQASVFASERILRSIMVIRAAFPGGFIVAVRAHFSQGGNVLIAVAVGAVGVLQPGPLFLGMAFLARYFLVRPFEGVGGRFVIVFDHFEGDVHGMALVAILSKLSSVDVLMTSAAASAFDEVGARLPRRRVAGVVALQAIRDSGVFPGQRVSGFGMIELLRLPFDE